MIDLNAISEFFINEWWGFYFGLIVFTIPYMGLLKKRSFFFLRLIVGIIVELVIYHFVPDYSLVELLPSVKTVVGAIFFFILLVLCFSAPIKSYIFVMLSAHITQHLSLCISEIFTLYFGFSETNNVPLYILFIVGGFILTFSFSCIIMKVRYRRCHDVKIVSPSLVLIMVFLFILAFWSQRIANYFNVLNTPFRIYDGTTCVLGLALMFYELDRTNLDFENQIIQELLKKDEKRFAALSTSIENVKRKAHDLKYIEAAWKSNNKDATEFLEEVNKQYKIDIEKISSSGNPAIDTIITEKLWVCADKGITFSHMVDCKPFSFISNVDLAVLLGNILDNAIEAVSELETKEKRIVSIVMQKKKCFGVIHVENYCEKEIKFFNGLPTSTKGDDENHGYGLKSAKYIVQKNNGNIKFCRKNNVFNVDIVFNLNDRK